MRKLTIVLYGQSEALAGLGDELRDHGHAVQHWRQAPILAIAGDLLVADGSLTPPVLPADLQQLHLAVNLGADDPSGLPAVQLLCWHRLGAQQRLLLRLAAPVAASGNGQALRQSASQALLEAITPLIAGFGRDPERLRDMPELAELDPVETESLLSLDALAYRHRCNRTARPDLLEIARQSLSLRLLRSVQGHGQRTALLLEQPSGERAISYAQLQQHAATIQAGMRGQLAEQGAAQPVIGVCLPRSPALYAAILAVLASGAVYLPLDPAQPLHRQRFILQNAGAALLLHDGGHPLVADGSVPGLALAALAGAPGATLVGADAASDAPCMALYTSGTTGQPKGVLISQHNLSHFTAWYADYAGLHVGSRVLQFSTPSFDSSVIDIFPTLLSGACLVVPSDDQRRDPLQLVELIERQRLTHGFLPPALLSILPSDRALGLQQVMTGGDVCEPWVIERLAGQCQLHNLYGPTEATVLVTARRMQAGDSNRNLGLPVANAGVLILDEQRRPVADGEAGEIHIFGAGVGLGYIGNRELTEQRYLWLQPPGAEPIRAYRTGDIGRWAEDGIELSGRLDNQVKIRGFRVEPEEIERCLRDSQLYAQVAVVIDGQRRILAFVAEPRGDDASARLKAHALAHLPDYMQPTLFTELAQLPAASNGKVDRQALLALPLSFPEREQHRLPASEDERRLLGLWSELLELPEEQISTDESFFNLGGHSIMLSRLLVLIREHFGCGISINRFIEQPTLCNLAQLVGGTGAVASSVSQQAFDDAERALPLNVLALNQMGDVHKVIVTGANGFLGVHLVQALLEWGASEVACLVRAPDDATARQRLVSALQDNRLGQMDLARVRVYAADMTRPRLGLSAQDYQYLDSQYGALIHNAANVNHVLDYASLVADNVDPLHECLKLCEGRRKKVFNYVSTLSACSAIDEQGNVLEAPAASTPPIYIRNGYNLSKWVAERLLERARLQGVQVNIYRPGNIAFNSRTGVSQPQRNRLMLMLKGSLQLGVVPALELNFDLMPVDFLARFIAFHSSRYQAQAAVFNLHNPEPLSWVAYLAAFREAGHDFRWASVEQWQGQLKLVDSSNALFGVLGFYLDGFEEDIGDISAIQHANAAAGVRRMGLQYPGKTPALLRTGCNYLHDINFLTPARSKTMNSLKPDTLVHNPEGRRVISAVEIPADSQTVWNTVGNFAGFASFIPALSHTEMTGSGAGSVRKKLFKDGNVVIEQLNSRDDVQRYMTWSLIHTTLPVGNLWASMHVETLGEGQCKAVWTIIAEPVAANAHDLPAFEAFLQGFADHAMGNVKNLFA
ncbi:amino acid adenylation domain-containing protein [Pseudomonas sp. HR96]|uniref:amino acid adenylation domain-containing protein n=1 Tax=Pseudomonas sp. HR96 TaxID=1027966 RepID=UPI002A75233F|nr:amino acid adenylation domain-containing protein [Pseudomonas sp. HR96]WPP00025.1 amino acid adenylation domain-containing protein [Pseudomonas sp. HR96]